MCRDWIKETKILHVKELNRQEDFHRLQLITQLTKVLIYV